MYVCFCHISSDFKNPHEYVILNYSKLVYKKSYRKWGSQFNLQCIVMQCSMHCNASFTLTLIRIHTIIRYVGGPSLKKKVQLRPQLRSIVISQSVFNSGIKNIVNSKPIQVHDKSCYCRENSVKDFRMSPSFCNKSRAMMHEMQGSLFLLLTTKAPLPKSYTRASCLLAYAMNGGAIKG